MPCEYPFCDCINPYDCPFPESDFAKAGAQIEAEKKTLDTFPERKVMVEESCGFDKSSPATPSECRLGPPPEPAIF